VAPERVLHAPARAAASGRASVEPRHFAATRTGQIAIRAAQLHRQLRLSRRRAPRGRRRRQQHAERRLRGPRRREPARALRADAAQLGSEPRVAARRSGAPGRRRTLSRVAPVHCRRGRELRGRTHADPSDPRGAIRRRRVGCSAAAHGYGSVVDFTTLGRTELRVSVAGMGCGGPSRLGMATGKTEDESIAVVRAAMDAGINLLDTGEVYGTEEIVGKAIAGRRDDVVIATKAWWQNRQGALRSRNAVKHALEASLRRLGTDRVEVYFLHGVTPD